MNNLEKSLAAIDRLLENYSNEELLSLLDKIKQNRTFDGPTIEEYFGIAAGITFQLQQTECSPHQPVAPPWSPASAGQKYGLGFSGALFFV